MRRLFSLMIIIASLMCFSVKAATQINRSYEEAKQLAQEAKYAFEYACEIGTREALANFIYYYPEGIFAQKARRMIYDIDLWDEATAENTIDAYNEYLAKSEIKIFDKEAKDAIDACLWSTAKQEDTIDAYNEYLSESTRKIFETEAKDAIDACLWLKAKQADTINAYNEYLSESTRRIFETEANNAIDACLWSKAKQANTIDSYNEYLSESKWNGFETEANNAICEIRSAEEWKHMKNSSDISEIESFIQKYPNSSYASNAKRQINELSAVQAYNENDLLLAADLFEEAGGRNALVYPQSLAIYDKCKEYSDYVWLSNNVTEYGLSSFRANYPNSMYYNELSNKLAIAKAQSLSMFSYETDGPKAMTYATDTATRDIVKSYIDECKKSDKRHKRELRRQKHDANGNLLQFGLEIFDFGICGVEKDELLIAYNVGMSMKIGNYKDPLQFEIGAKIGLMGDVYNKKMIFHLPLYARLKLNICSVGENTKWYIDGAGYYNAVTKDYMENDFAFSVGTGFAGKYCDWSLYVKPDIRSNHSDGNLCFGTSLKCYF